MAVKITRKRKNCSKRKTGKVMNGGSFRAARPKSLRSRSGRSRIPNPFDSIRSKSGSVPGSPTIIVVNPGAAADPGPHLRRGLTGGLASNAPVQRLISKFSNIQNPGTMRRAPINPGSSRVSKLVNLFTRPQ